MSGRPIRMLSSRSSNVKDGFILPNVESLEREIIEILKTARGFSSILFTIGHLPLTSFIYLAFMFLDFFSFTD
jgi:hypothetical protein